jgi:DNA repair protein RecO (recombination protein O)
MGTIKSPALIIKSMNWRDSSRILSLFTREFGRLDVIAKGVNRSTSQSAGILEPLNLIEAVIYFSEKRELQLLGKADLETAFVGIRGDLEKMKYGLGILEILYVFFRDHNPATEFYNFVVYLLAELEKGIAAKIIFWYFMLKLTSYLGFKPEFKHCHICNEEIKNGQVYFSFESGSVICLRCGDSGTSRINLSSGLCKYLAELQLTHYKKIGSVKDPIISDDEITIFLQNYLRFHTNEKLELNAIKYYELTGK